MFNQLFDYGLNQFFAPDAQGNATPAQQDEEHLHRSTPQNLGFDWSKRTGALPFPSRPDASGSINPIFRLPPDSCHEATPPAQRPSFFPTIPQPEQEEESIRHQNINIPAGISLDEPVLLMEKGRLEFLRLRELLARQQEAQPLPNDVEQAAYGQYGGQLYSPIPMVGQELGGSQNRQMLEHPLTEPPRKRMKTNGLFGGSRQGSEMMVETPRPLLPAPAPRRYTAEQEATREQALQALASFSDMTIDVPSVEEPDAILHSFDDGVLRTPRATSTMAPAPNSHALTFPQPALQPTPPAAPLLQAHTATVPHPGYTTARNGQRRVSAWNYDFKAAAHASARLPACEIGAVELVCFFPNHTQWPKALLRLIGNGWNTKEIATAQLHARGALSAETHARRNGALRHQVIDGGNLEFGVTTFTQKTFWGQITDPARVGGVASYDASVYVTRPKYASKPTAASLIDVARDVVNWPAPEDRGIVTQVIELAVQNGLQILSVDDILQTSQHFGFTMPTEAAGAQWDQNGLRRILAAVGADGPYN
ncbi:hypothetical protein LTR36_007337 [Oleoguttula mirabilis]|uniref:Uncharacterized protein n=1 Tax=Oleoguttula mirabilis TaxID=1507867 RepID=A0AAV9JAL4_9PEZI|nr:hypothetical protein LTR36_007337 [Oleoguttula mirabilis]